LFCGCAGMCRRERAGGEGAAPPSQILLGRQRMCWTTGSEGGARERESERGGGGARRASSACCGAREQHPQCAPARGRPDADTCCCPCAHDRRRRGGPAATAGAATLCAGLLAALAPPCEGLPPGLEHGKGAFVPLFPPGGRHSLRRRGPEGPGSRMMPAFFWHRLYGAAEGGDEGGGGRVADQESRACSQCHPRAALDKSKVAAPRQIPPFRGDCLPRTVWPACGAAHARAADHESAGRPVALPTSSCCCYCARARRLECAHA